MSRAIHCGVTGCTKELFKNQFCLEHYQKNQAGQQTKKKPVLIMKNKETIDDLLDGVRKQQKFGRMVEYSIECLRKLAVDEVSVEEEVELGTIETLMDAILANPNNEKLHKMFMELLAQFALNSRMAELVGNKLGHKYKLITDSFNKFKDPETHVASCQAILKLAEHDANIDDMVKDGILDSLNALVKQHPHNPDVVAAAAACLEKFARRNREYAQKIMDSGSVDVIIAAMKEFPQHLPLAQAGSALLAALAGSKPEYIEHLKAAGAVDALIAVIEAHPYDQTVLDNAARALKLLTSDSDMMHALNVVHGNMVADIETLKALTRIAALLLVDDNVDYMMQNNGIDWLISTMSGLAKDLSPMANKILTQGCLALARTANNENNIYSIMQAGGVKLLTSLIEGHMEDEGLVAAALTALLRMATRPENCVYIGNCGGIKAALAAMKRWPKSEQVITPAVGLLSALAGVAEPGKQIAKLGGIEQLIQALKDHIKNPEICTSIINALGKLANSPENVGRMVDAGLLPLLVKLLNEHPLNLPLNQAVLGVMETCCLIPDNVKQLLTLGAVQAVKGAMHRHQDGEVQATGQRVLDLLSGAAQQVQAQKDLEEEERRRKEQEERDRRRLEREMADALAKLKLEEEHAARLQREKDARERRAIELAESQRKMKEDLKKQEEEHLKKLLAGQQKPKEVKKPAIQYKSARKVFVDDEADRKPVEFEEWAKQLLLAGALLTKHSKAAPPRSRHVYLSADLKYLNWKKPAGQLKAKNRMPVTFIHEVTKGCTTPQLQRTKGGKPMAKEELSFSVFGSDSDDHAMRTLDLEARTIAECDRWTLAIQNLIDWAKSKKLYGANDTIHYQENDEVWGKESAKPALYA